MLLTRVLRWPYYQQDPEKYKKKLSEFYYFMIEGYKEPFGYVHSSFIKAIPWPSCWSLDHEKRLLSLLSRTDFQERTSLIKTTLRTEHEKGEVDALRKWANELFPVYSSKGEHVLDMDGCGVDLLGIVNFAVNLLAFVNTKASLKF